MQDDKIISVLNGAVKLKQIENGFKTSIDAVLLAAACLAQKGETVLDLGCGIGSASLCLTHRVSGIHLHGIDIQVDHVAIAQENASLNGLEASFEQSNVQSYQNELVDHIICNPPFEDAGAHLTSPSDKNATARGHINETSLEDWIKCAFNNLKSGGSLTIVHKTSHLQKIITALGKSFGQTEIIPLWPKKGKAAKRVIIRTLKHRKSPSIMHSGLVLHNEDGTYTDQADEILRNAKGLYPWD